jgi:hypothetical protein
MEASMSSCLSGHTQKNQKTSKVQPCDKTWDTGYRLILEALVKFSASFPTNLKMVGSEELTLSLLTLSFPGTEKREQKTWAGLELGKAVHN